MTLTSHVLTINEEQLHTYYQQGESMPLLFIHGNMSKAESFTPLLEHFEGKHTIIAPDLRGFGASSYHKEAIDIEDYANDVVNVLKALNHDQVIGIAHGSGTTILMRLALDHPQLIKRMIFISPASVMGHPVKKRWLFNLLKSKDPIETLEGMKQHVAPMEKNKADQQRFVIKQMLNSLFFNTDKPHKALFETFINGVFEQRNLAAFNLALARFNIYSDDNTLVDGTNETRRFTQPSLIIHGDKDQVMPIGISNFNRGVMKPKPELKVINGASYVPFVGHLPKVIKTIETFLKPVISAENNG